MEHEDCPFIVPHMKLNRPQINEKINLKIPQAYGLSCDKSRKTFFPSKRARKRQESSKSMHSYHRHHLNHRSLLGCYKKVTITAEEQEERVRKNLMNSLQRSKSTPPRQGYWTETESLYSLSKKLVSPATFLVSKSESLLRRLRLHFGQED